VFDILDTLEGWAETEREESSGNPSSSRSSSKKNTSKKSKTTTLIDWPRDEAVERIHGISSRINLRLRAKAARMIGSSARALKYVEMFARQTIVPVYFDGIPNPEIGGDDDDDDDDDDDNIMKDGENDSNLKDVVIGAALAPILFKDSSHIQMLLGNLLDVDGMSIINQECTRYGDFLMEEIHAREVCGDWASALQSYEQAIQLKTANDTKRFENFITKKIENGNGDGDDGVSKSNSISSSTNNKRNKRKRSKEELNTSQPLRVSSLAPPPSLPAIQQTFSSNVKLERGMLKSLLELGQIESVLNQVGGMLNRRGESR